MVDLSCLTHCCFIYLEGVASCLHRLIGALFQFAESKNLLLLLPNLELKGVEPNVLVEILGDSWTFAAIIQSFFLSKASGRIESCYLHHCFSTQLSFNLLEGVDLANPTMSWIFITAMTQFIHLELLLQVNSHQNSYYVDAPESSFWIAFMQFSLSTPQLEALLITLQSPLHITIEAEFWSTGS